MILEKLISECQKNQPKAQEQLYQLFEKKFFGLCLKYSSSYADAQDNFQEGFLIIFRKINQYSGKGSFEGWAKRLVVNYVLQQYRNQGTFLELVSDNIFVVEEVEIDDESVTMEFLLKIIQELPDRYRLVFNLYAVDGYSHKEIAKMLEINEGTSKSNLARAKMILKEKIQNTTVFSKTK